MPASKILEFHRRPSAFVYMLRGLRPSKGLEASRGFPPVRALWRGLRFDRRQLDEFLRLTELRADDGVPMLYPHASGFRLQMAVLTHPAFPLSLWSVLQIRNHLLQHRQVSAGEVLDMETRVSGQRILEKGAEVDLHTTLRSRDELVWESLNTFYYRGRFGEAGAVSPLASAPQRGEALIARWRTLSGAGWRIGRLTGDYNGIHTSRWYARLFGFRRAFHHPQLVLGQCMARLPSRSAGQPQRLDAWLKGPVYYGSDVALHGEISGDSAAFALIPHGESRPAVLGRWASCAAGSRLVDEQGAPV